MIPLGYFLIAWIVLLGLYAVLVLLTLLQMIRHGLHTPAAYISTFLFIIVILAVVIGSGLYFSGVDWTGGIDLLPDGLNLFFFGEEQKTFRYDRS